MALLLWALEFLSRVDKGGCQPWGQTLRVDRMTQGECGGSQEQLIQGTERILVEDDQCIVETEKRYQENAQCQVYPQGFQYEEQKDSKTRVLCWA